MTPRENMKRALDFKNPERLPINGYGEHSDCVWIGTEQIKPEKYAADKDLDQWLCRWDHTEQANMGQVKGHPLEDLSQLKDYPFPDANDPRRYVNVKKQLDEVDADPKLSGKFRICSIFMLLWERLQALHGFENCMYDIMDNTPEINELADKLVQYDVDFIRNMHQIAGDRIDAFNFSEDWGTESDLMMSPETFRAFFFPRYKRIFSAARERGWYVWMHSCGKINKAIPQLIEAGVSILNMQQPLANGIDEIGKQFAGKVCFETLCDIQRTLPTGDRGAITAQSRKLMELWGTQRGGFVLGDYGDHRAIGADPEVKKFMLESFRGQDPWANRNCSCSA